MISNTKYETLINVLDTICQEAPLDYKSYHPERNDTNGVNKARSKAFIHLFLKVKCGLTDFKSRHVLITEGTQDGGLDAYFLDNENKKLYLIQSKFKTTIEGSSVRSVSANDLIHMEINRILQGHSTDSNGIEFNSKVKSFQTIWRQLSDHAQYNYKVIILGNLKQYSEEQIKKIIDYADYEEYDFEKCYQELMLPVCTATFYDPKEINITIKLSSPDPSTLKRLISTMYGGFNVRILFVPAKEIGRIMSKYRNSILKYNPRNYLSLSSNKVNRNIRDTILLSRTNEFALYNNGITIIATRFKLSETTGTIESGQVIIGNPQIINGGQTAYTLSKMYEENFHNTVDVFNETEVMLKVIVVNNLDSINKRFIDDLSNSTNQQSRVEEADRRSNDKIQLTIQESIFKEFGYFYERKRGEFYYGLEKGYIQKDLIIDRYDFLRAYMALGGQPRWARQRGSETLFRKDYFEKVMTNPGDFRRMFFAFIILKNLYSITDFSGWGNGLRYGKMAIIAAINCLLKETVVTSTNLFSLVEEKIEEVKNKWFDFEKYFSLKANNIELYSDENGFDFDNYYKGKTLDEDVITFFK